MSFKDGTICITGGAGFLGTAVVSELQHRGYHRLIIPRSRDYDLTRESDVAKLFRDHRPNVLIHLAAVVGGIGANRAQPASFYYKNLMMGALTMEYARRSGVEKYVAVGTICSYPKICAVPFREDDLWQGYPEETNAPYGIAKKGLLVQAQAYRQQYDFNAIYLLLVNLYGPGDNSDPTTSHVIPALIRKCVDAVRQRDDRIIVWGSGNATREFLYVTDAAAAIASAMERYNDIEPINLGTGREIAIRQLVEMIARLCGFGGSTVFDASYPDGQPRRCVDTMRARERLGFEASTTLEDGLAETIRWYRSREPSENR